MINIDQAVSIAKDFVGRSGNLFTVLDEASRKNEKWVVVLRSTLTWVDPGRYIVELDSETGEIVGFKKE